MIFTEFRFFPFFLAAFLVHWALRRDIHRKSWLLACSYLFYAAWDWRFLSLILGSTLLDWFAGRAIHASSEQKTRKRWLLLSLAGNLGILGAFKYFGFFAESAAALLAFLGFEPHWQTLKFILPVGISFYTFQTMSYSLDIYFRKLKPTRSFLDLAVFVGFFPQLVAGPIVRAADFLPQLTSPRIWNRVDVRGALVLFMVGFIKKACISDNIAGTVDQYFNAPASFDVLSAWIGVTFYSVQIYCDFSGYSDMAIACAALLGYQLRLNFNFPYFASDISDFWRRWHMSLSSWLRDYLYIPLGGSRNDGGSDGPGFALGLAGVSTLACWAVLGSPALLGMGFGVIALLSVVFGMVVWLMSVKGRRTTNRNLMLTMLLGGLWHGAAWNFVIWGALHGLALAWHKEWSRALPDGGLVGGLRKTLAPFVTFWFVCVAWIFFRAEGVEVSRTVFQAFVLFHSEGTASLGSAFLLALLPALAILHLGAWRGWTGEAWRKLPPWAFAAGFGLFTAGILPFVQPNSQPFIYFQF
jgi:alginate O-acetyltransferase complex protein AlgI